MSRTEKTLLEQIFGKQEPASEEEKYDAVISEAERIYLREKDIGNPYSFHKAFEFAIKECDEKDISIP